MNSQAPGTYPADHAGNAVETPAKAAAGGVEAIDVLKEYEAWEADVILSGIWDADTPRLTQSQWDQLVYIQGRRNDCLAAHPVESEVADLRAEVERFKSERSYIVGHNDGWRDCLVDGSRADENYEIGKRDGYEKAVQDIDELTGGDGEYCCVVGADANGRHCPGPEEMKARIVGRFNAAETALALVKEERDRAREALEPFAEAARCLPNTWQDHEAHWNGGDLIVVGDLRRARAALSKPDADRAGDAGEAR